MTSTKPLTSTKSLTSTTSLTSTKPLTSTKSLTSTKPLPHLGGELCLVFLNSLQLLLQVVQVVGQAGDLGLGSIVVCGLLVGGPPQFLHLSGELVLVHAIVLDGQLHVVQHLVRLPGLDCHHQPPAVLLMLLLLLLLLLLTNLRLLPFVGPDLN